MAEDILKENSEDGLNVSSQANIDMDDIDDLQETASFLKLSELKLKCRARNLRLKEEDVIVAVDGEPFHGSILELTNVLSEEDKKTLLTIRRQDIFFEVITSGSLGSTFKFTSTEETIDIEKTLKKHAIYSIEKYTIFEILRDLRRKVDIIDTTESSMSWILPPFWLIQNKLWEVLLVTISVYLITFSVAWWMFAITWILLAIYFNKGQTTILRSFSIYRDKHFWIILAATSEKEAQEICRKLDPKCNFDYPLIPPIENSVSLKKRKAYA
tara:strand:- start:95 stop:904 length:810 start_codon:yes stop_codon:yes gene_type:complete